MKIYFIFFVFLLSSSLIKAQEKIAVVGENIDSLYFTLNDEIIDWLNKKDTFLIYIPSYDTDSYEVWTKSGKSGFVRKDMVRVIENQTLYKLVVDKDYLIEFACSDYVISNFKSLNIDLCQIINESLEFNLTSLDYFFKLHEKLDGALLEIHGELSWKILNYYPDQEFCYFLKGISSSERIKIGKYLTDENITFPITNYPDYYKLFYPLTWDIFNQNN